MHYVGLALYAEGSSDYHFLSPVLRRLAEAICLQDATQLVELSEEVIALDHVSLHNRSSREDRIFNAALMAKGAWRIIFIHADADGNSQRALEERVLPAIELIHKELPNEGACVPVIPIRETEAWPLADGNVLRLAFASSLTDGQLGLPVSALEIEGHIDPKFALNSAFEATSPSPSKRRAGITYMLNSIGENISLEQLRRLSSFNQLENDLRRAFKSLRIIG